MRNGTILYYPSYILQVEEIMENEFEKYILRSNIFRGSVDLMANSIELILGSILGELKVELKTRIMLGTKIKKLAQCKNVITQINAPDFDKLTGKLIEFNNIWIITKHGMVVGGSEELTFYKDGKISIFDSNKQMEIRNEFTEIMTELTKIHRNL
jgi:hypothetical protein